MTEKELKKRCKLALAEMERKADDCSLCNHGQGYKSGMEDAYNEAQHNIRIALGLADSN